MRDINKDKIISHIESCNLTQEDKEYLIKLVKENKLEEVSKFILKVLGISSTLLDLIE